MADLLAARDAGRLTEFARAFKAAARAVALYPDNHPAIGATLGRLAQLTGTAHLVQPLRLSIAADTVLLDGAAAGKADSSIAELAVLLHAHRIGALTVHPGADVDAWHRLLQLLGRSADDLRRDGGFGRLWQNDPLATRIDVREIDYAEVLRERDGHLAAAWQEVIMQLLGGDRDLRLPSELLESIRRSRDRDRTFGHLLDALVAAVADAGGNADTQAAAIVRLIRALWSALEACSPEDRDDVIRDLAMAIGRLSPELLLAIVDRSARSVDGASDQPLTSVLAAIPDGTIASFVAEHATEGPAALDRVAQAFQALVVDRDRRERLVAMAHDTAIVSGAEGETFERSWQAVAERLLSGYSDRPFVSTEYARELGAVHARAVAIEQLHEDPPERTAAWLDSVSTGELRRLDVLLVSDLLRLEDDPEKRAGLIEPVVSLADDLLLVGDVDAAAGIVDLLAADIEGEAPAWRAALARTAFDRLATATTLQHLIAHIASLDEPQLARVRTMCNRMGQALVPLVADAIAAEHRPRIRERLTEVLLACGDAGGREADRLRTSPDPDVRRAAIQLMRARVASDALPQLTPMMHDPDAAVRRDAVQAMLATGSSRAIDVLRDAMARGPHAARESLVQALAASRDSRAIPPLRDALYRSDWWAPRRSAVLRRAAAAALARIGTSDADDVLRDAATHGPRGVRAAVAASLARVPGPEERD